VTKYNTFYYSRQ